MASDWLRLGILQFLDYEQLLFSHALNNAANWGRFHTECKNDTAEDLDAKKKALIFI